MVRRRPLRPTRTDLRYITRGVYPLNAQMKLRTAVIPLYLLGFGAIGRTPAAALAYQPVRFLARQTGIHSRSLNPSKSMAQSHSSDIKETMPAETKLVYKIIRYPDPKLRADNVRVAQFNERLRKVTEGLLQSMYASEGMGLAAPQVGINERIMVFNAEAGTKPRNMILSTEKVLINPDITGTSTETELGEEGCLSFPRVFGDVARHTWIDVRYQSVTGEERAERFEGDAAVVFQHEYDHLDGVLFIDKLVPQHKVRNRVHLERLIRQYGPDGAV